MLQLVNLVLAAKKVAEPAPEPSPLEVFKPFLLGDANLWWGTLFGYCLVVSLAVRKASPNMNWYKGVAVACLTGFGGSTLVPFILGTPIVMVASRRHGAEQVAALERLIEGQLGPVEKTSMGSSLKLCLVAEGAADIYPRLAPTCEWDTAAAHAVVNAAGGVVVNTHFEPLAYNKPDVLNPHFLVLGQSAEDWRFIEPALA